MSKYLLFIILAALGGLYIGVHLAGPDARETARADWQVLVDEVTDPATPVADPPQESPVLQFMVEPPQALPSATPQPLPTPTAEFAPTAEFSPQFLADCAFAQSTGRRSSPRCPTNAAEMLGTGR